MANLLKAALRKYIWELMEAADLNVVSARMIRKMCEEKFKVNLSSRKKEVDKIVMAYVRAENSDESNESSIEEDDESEDDDSEEGDDSEENERPIVCKQETGDENERPIAYKKETKDENESPIACKIEPKDENDRPIKIKWEPSHSDSETYKESNGSNSHQSPKNSASSSMGDDAALAKQLQEEEWNFRQRSCRQSSRATKETTVKHKKKADNEGSKKASKGTGLYGKKCWLSPALAEIMETQEMSRPDIVKKMWSIARERELFDPSNKQFILCDDQLIKVFGRKRVKMFTMMKYLGKQIKDLKDIKH